MKVRLSPRLSHFLDGWAEVARLRRVCAEWSREVSRLTADLEYVSDLNVRLMAQLAGHQIESEG